MAIQAAQLYVKVGADIDEAQKALNRVKQQLGELGGAAQKAAPETSGLESALGGLAKQAAALFGISLGIGAVRQLANTAAEMAQLGAQSERLGNAFQTLSGANAAPMLERLRVASRGTVSDMALMQSANRAMMLGVTQDTDEMGRLLEAAAARGKAMGMSAEEAFNDVVTGIGRMSPMILDNLGILTGGQAGFEAYARSIGKSADALTDQEKRQYLLQKVFNDTTTAALESGKAFGDQASQFERLDASVTNIKSNLGEVMNRGALVRVTADVMEGIAAWARNMAGAPKLIDSYAQEKSGARVAHVLDDAGWTIGQSWVLGSAVNGKLNVSTRVGPVGDRELQDGIIDVQAATLKDTTALSHLQAVAEAEDGLVFVNRAGSIVFHDRQRQYKPPYSTPAVTFGDAEGELPFSNIELSNDDSLIYNEVRLTREGGAEQVAEDTESQQDYFRRTLSKSGLLLMTDASALSLATAWLGRYKQPYVRVSRLVFEAPLPDELWPVLLNRELGDRIAVRFQPPGGGARIEREALVHGITHKITDEGWTVELRTSPGDTSAVWILNMAKLGQTTRLLAG